MAFDVRMTAYARHRLNETISYIQYVCGNPTYATKLLHAALASVKKLETQESFRIVDHTLSDFVGETVYRIKLDKYKIVYRLKQDQGIVLIFLFMHESHPLDEAIFASFKSEN